MSTAAVDSPQGSLVPFAIPMPADAVPEIVELNIAEDDDRMWVPQTDDVWLRPLCFSVSGGYWVNLLKVKRSGILSRHRHPGPVHAHVLAGRWKYLEHEWTAETGSYAFEPPGETHTLWVPPDVKEMITLFHVTGSLIYVNEQGEQTGYEDVFTKIEACRRHFDKVGLGADFVRRFIR